MTELAKRAFAGVGQVLVATGLVLFLSAGTFHYWQAWTYIAVFGATSAVVTGYLLRHDRELLERRMRAGPGAEPLPSQRVIQGINATGLVVMTIVAGLDRRFGWTHVADGVAIAANGVAGALMLAMIPLFRLNRFTSGTVEVAAGQRVVDTGAYGWVRHPMYSGGLVLFLATPVALGSYAGLWCMPVLVTGIVLRLLDEERYLKQELQGYEAYCGKVRWRLLPGFW